MARLECIFKLDMVLKKKKKKNISANVYSNLDTVEHFLRRNTLNPAKRTFSVKNSRGSIQ